jgi:hypothetical protein
MCKLKRDTRGSFIRITHWQSSAEKLREVDLVFDSHPGIGRAAPQILIAIRDRRTSLLAENPELEYSLGIDARHAHGTD